ncbi:MAG: carbohydrate binding family 9 domain-containing protein [Ignavibacteria bacterium]|nr:carbohydrate binding family 9 domain-containing protein [Ignavibacteria bacterium]
MTRFLLLAFTTFLITLSVKGADSLTVKNNDVVILALKVIKPITIDGKLDEEVWQNGGGFENFIQRDPIEGAVASEKTSLKLAFDEDALYLGVKMYDSSPDSILARLSRRDEWVNSDHITLYLDPYNDKRSGYFFTLNAAGTLIDGVLFNDSWDDESWDGVWEGKISVDDEGWCAEMRIPFSQMRFNQTDTMVWGVNFRRKIARKNEWDFLVFIPKTESGFVSHFASLTGFDNISSSSQFEIIPYVTTRAEYIQFDDGDPFNDGSKYTPGAGADFRMGVGSNLTLNATVNPDFGQVEIDPAVINLSDVETFFNEKRPFFIEGFSTFNFGYGGARSYWGFNWGSPDFLYSRRIGRPPQGSAPDADYVDYPNGTHILAAGKLTGKLDDNWNIGTIHNVTKREYARISKDDIQSDAEVEPLAYYGVLRVQKEFNEGRNGIGGISTATLRSFQDSRLRDEINKEAFSFGLDGWTFFDESKTWVLAGWAGVSHLTGNQKRITDLQQDSRHYFQRPDASHVSVDSNKTSLTGYAGRFHINKQKGNFFVNTAFGFITPAFDVNDLGFMWRADKLNWHAGAGYEWTDPTDVYRYSNLGAAIFQNYDFGGHKTWEGIFHFGFMEFANYYIADWNAAYYTETFNNTRTRGGPLTINPPGYQTSIWLASDSRKDWEIGVGAGTFQTSPSYDWFVELGFDWRPFPNLLFSINPKFSRVFEYAQYIDTFDDPLAANTYGKRYVFGELDQKTLSASIRLNWTFTPQLSLQLYLQPLISSGNYNNFKELESPGTYDFIKYGENGSTFDPETNTADPDGNGPAEEIEISNPDFNFRSLRGNAVLRWEYLPGSVIYFVWTQTRSEEEEIGEFQFNKSMSRLFAAEPDNIFMVKVTYWINF